MTFTNNVMLIYTGGTIGMNRNPRTGALEPFNFEHLLSNVPELKQVKTNIATYQFNPPIDSSDMSPKLWIDLAHIIANNYDRYDGFVILHGTDTMAYTASALSYMLENDQARDTHRKPVAHRSVAHRRQGKPHHEH